MTITIKNNQLTAVIAKLGAELQSLKSNATGTEYVWTGDSEYWGKHAPILFPIVGALKDDQYTHQGQTYSIPKHGLARISSFEILEQATDQVSLVFHSNEETKKQYPFDFDFIVHFRLTATGLVTEYETINKSTEEMYFSVGGHPAFNVPLEAGLHFEDYQLSFAPEKERFEIPMVGNYTDLANKKAVDLNQGLPLTHELFANDVVVYESAGENTITLASDKSDRQLTMSYHDMPYVGIWTPAAKASPFVCIEPWAGIPDDLNASGELSEKDGILRLAGKESRVIGFELNIE